MVNKVIHKYCKKHGLTNHFPRKDKNSFRCIKCSNFYVSSRRIRIKELLIKEFGGKCLLCGYDKYIGALEFHHINSKEKEFSISGKTIALDKIRQEAKKCILICANCHAEQHKGKKKGL